MEEDYVLCGALINPETYNKFKKMCEDIGSDTSEAIAAFIYNCIYPENFKPNSRKEVEEK